jgi:hypothetical protein
VENRNRLIVDEELLETNGHAERDAAHAMLEQVRGTQRVTAAGDKGYDTAYFVNECRHLGLTPHVAQNTGRRGGSTIDARTTRHAGVPCARKPSNKATRITCQQHKEAFISSEIRGESQRNSVFQQPARIAA